MQMTEAPLNSSSISFEALTEGLQGSYPTYTICFEDSEVNELVLYLLFHYHNIISSILFMIGGSLLLIKLNRGFVKYQMRRTLWTTFSLIYVFMLSTVQIYNLY